MEAHCIALELKYQNHALKSGQHVQILNETSNKAKIKRDIDEIETINIELEHSVAKLLIQNKHLNKENKTLKKHYKDLYDYIKITRSRTIEQTTYLLTNNAILKAQNQDKVFAIVALKNDLRKLKGNSVDIKFAKTSVLGKPVLQSQRNQSVVKQSNAFKSKRPQMLKQRESRDSSKNMPRFSSNDMVHNHNLDGARKKTQERDRNSKTNVIPSTRFQSTADGSNPKPRSTNHSTRSLHVDSEPPHGSNVDIPNIHECKQTLDNMVAEKADISETTVEVDSKLIRKMIWKVHSGLCSTNMSMEKIKLFQKSSTVTTADASDKRQQQPDSTSSTSTL
ncbi:hypothetical protein Tco_1442430, partial [Tanacetum coccineum]